MKKYLLLGLLGTAVMASSAHASIYVGLGAPAPAPVYVAPQPAYVEPVYPEYVGGYYNHAPIYDRHHHYDWHYWHDHDHHDEHWHH